MSCRGPLPDMTCFTLLISNPPPPLISTKSTPHPIPINLEDSPKNTGPVGSGTGVVNGPLCLYELLVQEPAGFGAASGQAGNQRQEVGLGCKKY
ncbi:hypothetical protein HanXRQr2_Chr17g0790631 [Helianthus annuus]|uniref:Uncharacterized protein n=1 Tax=Helianthus annuus TaxID=4232 RepID=A0A9K3GT77_HELAN|nr:hypothetical protein HanXRQr2_Chr17g0790631 [Helianthus annuus]